MHCYKLGIVVQGKVVYSNNINVYMFYSQSNHIMINVYYHKEAGLDCLHLYKLVISMWWRDHAQIHGSCNISDVLMKLHCWNNQEGMFVCYERCTNPT